jgi:hypothetical protein
MTITLTREEAQQVLETLTFLDPRSLAASELQDDAIEILRARLAQPEPEPVAWTVGGLITDFSRDFSAYKTKAYTRPLYTTPPQREWQGLTDEEMSEAYNMKYNIYKEHVEYVDFVLIYRAIEAKLKEKNT